MSDDGPVLGVLNDMLSAFETKLGGEVAKDDEGNAITEALLDQPMFRAAVAVRAAAKRRVEGRERRGRRRVRRWGVPAFPGDLRGDQRAKSEGGHLLRRRQSTHFPQGRHAQRAHRRRPGLALRPGMREDRVGRQIRAVAPSIADTERRRKEFRDVRLDTPGVVNHAPGGNGVGSGLVAVHMVYSKARKRRDAMEAMGWWRAHVHGRGSAPDTQRRRELAVTESVEKVCEGGDGRGVLFAHTYFRQMDPGARAFVCARGTKLGGCPCCEPVPDEDGKGRDWAREGGGWRPAGVARAG